MLQEQLEDMGLRKNEAKVYLALLGEGTATPSGLAAITGLSRPYIYDVLETLRSKTLASFQTKNGRKEYAAADPRHLQEFAEEQLAKARKLAPALIRLAGAAVSHSEVSTYEGEYIYKALLRDITATMGRGGEILIFAIDDEKMMKSDRYYAAYLKRYFFLLGKKGITERAIVRRGVRQLKEAKTTKYRFIDGKYLTDAAFEVYGDTIALFEWGGKNRLVMIKNAKLAEAYRRQFEFFWEKSE